MSKVWILILVPLMVVMANVSKALDMMGGAGGLYLQTKTVGKVKFDHMVHGAECDACHPKIFIQKNNSNQVGMKAMEKGKSCGACHDGKKAFSVAGNCVTCHAGDILFKEKETGNVNFSHAVHVDMFGCDKCHPDLFSAEKKGRKKKATMAGMEKGESCGFCHNGNDAFSVAGDCEKCHKM
jgi:c(7)-type cytochrome triheme protein